MKIMKICSLSKRQVFILLCLLYVGYHILSGKLAIHIIQGYFPLQQRWEINLGERISKLTVSTDGKVIVRTIDSLASLDGNTGALLWKVPIKSGTNPSGAVIDGQDVFVSNEKTVYAFDLSNGLILWKSSVDNRIGNVESIVQAVSPCCVLVSSLKQSLISYDRYNGEVISQITSGGGDYARASISEDLVYVIYKGAKIMDKSTTITVWEEDWKSPGYEVYFLGSIAYFADGFQIAAFDFDTREFVWSIPETHAVDEIFGTSDYLLVSTEKLYALDPENGELLWISEYGGDRATVMNKQIYLLNSQKKQVRVLDLRSGKILGSIQLALPSIIQLNFSSEAIGAYQNYLIVGVDERVYGFSQP